MKLSIFVFLLLGCSLCVSEDAKPSFPRVVTSVGEIEGFYNTSMTGTRYEAYIGIPYAEPPIGQYRFAVAKRISPWTGVFKAKAYGPSCIQYNFVPLGSSVNRVSGSEDCLYLNIYSPVRRDENGKPIKLFPVMFFIPGGVFQVGSGNIYGPRYLMSKDAVLVTINYRLGPMGFLSTEDAVVPGNTGLKDQVIAMQFIKDNIKAFGGDPSKITLFGQSAGAASVHFHYLSPLTKGLFHAGLSHTGTALDCWAQAENVLQKAQKLAAVVGCTTKTTKSMVQCLRSRPATQIVGAIKVFTKWYFNPATAFAPCVEKGGSNFTFIDRSPVDILVSGDAHDVPWVTGVVSQEGLYPAAYYAANEGLFEALDLSWDTEAPYILDYNDTISTANKPKVGRLIKQYYLKNASFDRSTFNESVEMIGHRVFLYDVEKAVKLQARPQRGPVYAYFFSYRGAHSVTESMTGTTENFGVCHGDDLRYVLDATFDSSTTSRDRKMQQMMMNLWLSLANYGKPDIGIEWPKQSLPLTSEYKYMHIAGPNDLRMESDTDFGEKKFWHSLNFQENIIHEPLYK